MAGVRFPLRLPVKKPCSCAHRLPVKKPIKQFKTQIKNRKGKKKSIVEWVLLCFLILCFFFFFFCKYFYPLFGSHERRRIGLLPLTVRLFLSDSASLYCTLSFILSSSLSVRLYLSQWVFCSLSSSSQSQSHSPSSFLLSLVSTLVCCREWVRRQESRR
jgi:hypothetical protein